MNRELCTTCVEEGRVKCPLKRSYKGQAFLIHQGAESLKAEGHNPAIVDALKNTELREVKSNLFPYAVENGCPYF